MLSEGSSDAEVQSRTQMDADDGLVSDPGTVDLETRDREDEADLERKVEVLERMRARRGEYFPSISRVPIHA